MTNIVDVEDKMITLRNQQVILDSDVADLYGVKTKEINQAVKNNPRKFPEGYIWELSETEKTEVVKNFDHLQRLRFSPQLPKAFTERGLYMLATILKSPKAEDATISIIEAYAKLRELSRVITEIPQHENDKVTQQSLMQRGGQLAAELLTDNLPIQSSETSVELNLAMFKLKHTVKRENDNDERIARLEAELAELKKERQ
jgi:hypothetical protein